MISRLVLFALMVLVDQCLGGADLCGSFSSKQGDAIEAPHCALTVTRTIDAFSVGCVLERRPADSPAFPPTDFALRSILNDCRLLVLEGMGRRDEYGNLVGTVTDLSKNSGSFTITPTLAGATLSVSVSRTDDQKSSIQYKNLILRRE